MYYFLFIYTIVLCLIFYKYGVGQMNTKTNITIVLSSTRIKINRNKLIIWIILIALPFIYLSTQRDFSIGTDTSGTYQLIYYNGYAKNGWNVPLYEFLYIYYVKLMYAINKEYRFLLFATSAIICIGFITYFLKKANKLNVVVALCSFIALVFCFSLNGQRQALAMTMSLVFLTLLEKRKTFYSIVVLILIFFVHASGLVLAIYYIPYFFKDQFKDKKIIPIAFIIAPLLLPLIINLVTRIPIFARYQDNLGSFDLLNVNTKFLIFPLLMLPFIILFWDKLIKLQADNYIHLCGYVFIYSAILMSGYLWYAFRMMYYFVPSEIIIVSQLEKCCNKRQKILINSYILISLLLYFVFVYVMRDTDSIYPYRFGI